MNDFNDRVSSIWSVADLLRGPYKPAQYGDVMLPLVVLRRLDCVLEPTKPKVLERYAALKGQKHTEAELDAIPQSGDESAISLRDDAIADEFTVAGLSAD